MHWRSIAWRQLDEFPASAQDAFAHNAIEAVLHYSRRSALAFVSATRRAGLEISALALPQVCLSGPDRRTPCAMPVPDGLVVAKAPNEADLFDALEQVPSCVARMKRRIRG